jgi:membrane protease YdiL (CAAX protease family)
MGFCMVCAACIFLWVAKLPSKNLATTSEDWNIPQLSWLDQLLPLALCFLGVFLVQTVLGLLNKGLQLETLEYQILGTYTLQGTLIGMLIFLRIKFPKMYGSPLNKTKAESHGAATLHAFFTFLKFLPIIWLVNIWTKLSWQWFSWALDRLIATWMKSWILCWQWLGYELNSQKPVEMLLKALDEEPAKFWALAMGAIILAPMAEELLFRSYIYRFLKNKFSIMSATFISALFFAAMHVNLASLIPLFLLGVLFTLTYENTGNIVAPIIFHALFNASSICLIALTPYFPELQ